MPPLSPVDAAVSSSATIGKYFAAVNVIPSALFVLYVSVLVWAGAWSGPLELGKIGAAFDAFGWQDLAWFVASALVVAVAIHPLQFALTQVLEGYWGTSRLALSLTIHQVTRHHRKAVWIRNQRDSAYKAWVVAGSALWDPEKQPADDELGGQDLRLREREARRALARPSGSALLPDYLAHLAHDRQLRFYPTRLYRVMPTRLGNVLRRSEDSAGTQYGLDTLVIAPHLSLVAKPEHYAYVQDRQKAMDLAITMCLVGALGTGVTAVLLSDDGPWCMLSLIPFGVSYASYLGAVAAARSYNVAIETVTDLSRFALYEALHVGQPNTGKEEREMAETLMGLLRGASKPAMQLVHPEMAPDAEKHSLGPSTSVSPSTEAPPTN